MLVGAQVSQPYGWLRRLNSEPKLPSRTPSWDWRSPMPKTVGQEQDDAAFEEMAESWQEQRAPLWEQNDDWPDLKEQVAAMRYAFDAGMQRGEEKRGCYKERDA